MYLYVSVHPCSHVYAYVSWHAYVCVCVCVYVYVHVHMHNTHVYVSVYVYVYVARESLLGRGLPNS